MKRGYSPRIGGVVAATSLTHRDCRDDRVTCEICGERVFKVVRSDGRSEVHFLSHHRRTDLSRDCEARVAERMASDRRAAIGGRSEGQGQGLRDRVDALGRILARQFPSIARRAEATSARVARKTLRVKDGWHMPRILMDEVSYACMFQIAARGEGHVVSDDDLVRYDYADHWLSHVATLRRCGVDALRRTRCAPGSRQEMWARDMTALISIAQSQEALMALLRHACADLAETGIPGGTIDQIEAVRRLTLVGDVVVGPSIDGLLLEHAPGRTAAEQGEPYYVIAMTAIVARMRDVLREIDYDADVPAAGETRVTRHPSMRMTREGRAGNRQALLGGAAAPRAPHRGIRVRA